MTKSLKVTIFSLTQFFLLFGLTIVPSVALAQVKCEPGLTLDTNTNLCLPANPYKDKGGIAGATSIGKVITIVLKILLTLAGVVAVVFVIYAGYSYITSGGNEEQATKAKKVLFNAILGLILIILSFVIISVITNTLTTGGIFSGSSGPPPPPGNGPPPNNGPRLPPGPPP